MRRAVPGGSRDAQAEDANGHHRPAWPRPLEGWGARAPARSLRRPHRAGGSQSEGSSLMEANEDPAREDRYQPRRTGCREHVKECEMDDQAFDELKMRMTIVRQQARWPAGADRAIISHF